ncbi:hypothetical protein MJO28_003686 [Puccinia striiformis f. sp. tritici]|uniref:Uncharacterized protein n=1 Tax=Puccinia striiformis f. sp. tritici TaxID=168172 RepID=A0ACC0EMA7_9BASI|nr:hypothetical protein Pst134EB_008775 [Puccinia striiformis f. sp. tritici]KAI7956591.1 hypothetical protein MJO28_003686 [Puccinia striiformis f. sp. tritici]
MTDDHSLIPEEGSVENNTNQCIFAILKIEKDFVTWPTTEERINIKRQAHPDDPFCDCIGYVDGTIIQLVAAPVIHKEDYWMRKKGLRGELAAGLYTTSCVAPPADDSKLFEWGGKDASALPNESDDPIPGESDLRRQAVFNDFLSSQ